jgi:hypothetical protein
MARYFLLLENAVFEDRIRPALSAAWRTRSFEPCQELCRTLLPQAQAFQARFHVAEEPMLAEIARGLPFERHLWRHLVGECLWYAAVDIPELETCPETLACLVKQLEDERESIERRRCSPISQAHGGSRDLVFGGGTFRPENAGYNDRDDVRRLAAFLEAVDRERWSAEQLAVLPSLLSSAERADELEFAREWFPALLELYQEARQRDWIVVCETV